MNTAFEAKLQRRSRRAQARPERTSSCATSRRRWRRKCTWKRPATSSCSPEQLPRPCRPSRSRRSRQSRARRSTAPAPHRCGSSAARSTSTARSRSESRRFFGIRSVALVRVVLERERQASSRPSATAGQHDHLRRAQPRLDHRRLPSGRRRSARATSTATWRDLEQKLRDADGHGVHRHRRRVFDGRLLAKLPEIVALAHKYDAVTIVDDSHGTGVMGKTGRGTIEHFGLDGPDRHHHRHARQSARRRGGRFRRGSRRRLIDTLVQRSRTQLFSNALPATVAAARSRRSSCSNPQPRSSRRCARTRAISAPASSGSASSRSPDQSAIVPIIVGETAFAIAMSDRLLKEGVFVTGFGFPVVPEGTARIRVQMSSAPDSRRAGPRARRIPKSRPRAGRDRRDGARVTFARGGRRPVRAHG